MGVLYQAATRPGQYLTIKNGPEFLYFHECDGIASDFRPRVDATLAQLRESGEAVQIIGRA